MKRILSVLLLTALSLLTSRVGAETVLNASLVSTVGGEADPHQKRNQTIGLVLTQNFFDSLQHDLIVPLVLNLEEILNVTF